MDFPVPLPPDILALAASLNVDPAQVEERFIRGGGPGGQKINKTASAVQLFHRPTATDVKVQRFREQSKNRLAGWKLLILKLEEQERGKDSRVQREIHRLKKQKQRRSRRAQEKVLDAKHRRTGIKELRSTVREEA